MNEQRERYEQLAIDTLMTAFCDGATYRGKDEIREALASQCPPDDPSFLTRDRAASYSCEATKRLARLGISVVSPTVRNGYLRTKEASAEVREESRLIGEKQIRTRVANHAVLCQSDARQQNATEQAKDRALVFQAMAAMVEGLYERLPELLST